MNTTLRRQRRNASWKGCAEREAKVKPNRKSLEYRLTRYLRVNVGLLKWRWAQQTARHILKMVEKEKCQKPR